MLYIADNFVNSVQSSCHLSEIRANESKLARLFGVPNAEELDDHILAVGWEACGGRHFMQLRGKFEKTKWLNVIYSQCKVNYVAADCSKTITTNV